MSIREGIKQFGDFRLYGNRIDSAVPHKNGREVVATVFCNGYELWNYKISAKASLSSKNINFIIENAKIASNALAAIAYIHENMNEGEKKLFELFERGFVLRGNIEGRVEDNFMCRDIAWEDLLLMPKPRNVSKEDLIYLSNLNIHMDEVLGYVLS